MPATYCPNCRFALELYTATTHRHELRLPEECPRCHVRRPIDSHARLAARLAGTHPDSAYQPAVPSPIA